MDRTREPDCIGPPVPGYRLIRSLSKTPMSEVFLAEETSGQRRRVALKTLDLAGVRPELVARFERETAIARDLRHPHVVETYDTGRAAGHHYIAMRYVDGPDLGWLLRMRGPLAPERAVQIGRQIAVALDAAHRRQLVHRDVKPANILLDSGTGNAYLCDFGIAKDLRAAATITHDGGPLTPYYAAPEQQTPGRITPQADVYALAGVLYHCLTGQPPFDRDSTWSVLRAHWGDPPPLASTVRGDLPRDIDGVFRRGLAKRPEDRHRTCGELVADLAAVLDGRPRPRMPRAGGLRHVVAPASSRIAVVTTVLLLVAALAAVLVVQPWRHGPPPAASATRSAPPRAPAFPTAAERSLVTLIGDSGCHRAAADAMRGVLAAVSCTPPGTGATDETYYQFDSLTHLRTAFDHDSTTARAPNGVDCSEGKAPGFLGNRRYDLRSVDLGGLQCHPGPNSGLVMEWSVEPLRVLGRATGTDAAALAGWWRAYYGPPTSAIVAAVNREASPPFPTPRESALLAHIPPTSRDNCVRPSDSQVKLNVGDRPVIGVVCGPTSGAAIVFYYQFRSVAAMNASYGVPQLGGTDCTTETTDKDGFDGEHAYSRGGESGRLECATDNTGERSMTWTDNRLAIEGLAFQGGDPAAMIDWWLNDAGPT